MMPGSPGYSWSGPADLQGAVRDRICHDLCLPGRYMEAQWEVLTRNIMSTFNAYLYLKMREGKQRIVSCILSIRFRNVIISASSYENWLKTAQKTCFS